MTDIKRHIVWACFGIDANSPEEAKRMVERILTPHDEYQQDLFLEGNVNVVVFFNPALDKLFEHTDMM